MTRRVIWHRAAAVAAVGAIVVGGFILGGMKANEVMRSNFVEYKVVVSLHSGDTIDGVSSRFYNSDVQESYDAFRYRVLGDNYELFKDGRQPQVGDKIVVWVRESK